MKRLACWTTARTWACALLLVGLGVALPGCVKHLQLIRVNGDGGGTIVVTKLKTATARNLSSFGEEDTEVPQEEEVRALSKRLGPGVEFQSVKAVENKEWRGYIATFSFADVTTLTLRTGASYDDDERQDSGQYQFAFTRKPDGRRSLVIRTIEAEETEEMKKEEESKGAIDSHEWPAEVKRVMLAGFELREVVEVEGTLVQTNSPHVDGNRVTLVEFDLEQLYKSERRLKAEVEALVDAPAPETLQEAEARLENVRQWLILRHLFKEELEVGLQEDVWSELKGVDGLRAPLEEEVRIEFEVDATDDR